MANTTFATLKINALRRAGNNYASADTTRLELAGGLINEVLGMIGGLIKGHPYTLDIGNTIATVADTPYSAPTETDIVEILNYYQRVTNRQSRQITYDEYIALQPDPTRWGGIPDLLWAPVSVVSASGVLTWRIYHIPTPSSVITGYFDYIKSLQFSADGVSANGEFCAIPPVYNKWIYDEFKPLFYEIIDPKNRALIDNAYKNAEKSRAFHLTMILSQVGRTQQVDSRRESLDYRYNRVAATPAP